MFLLSLFIIIDDIKVNKIGYYNFFIYNFSLKCTIQFNYFFINYELRKYFLLLF